MRVRGTAIFLALGMLACRPEGDRPTSTSEPQSGAAVASAPLVLSPELADLRSAVGTEATYVIRSLLRPRSQALLGGSYHRFLGYQGGELQAAGDVVFARPQLFQPCHTAAFWLDLRANALSIRLPVGGAVRRFDEQPGIAAPPAAMAAELRELEAAVARECPKAWAERIAPPTPPGRCGELITLDAREVYMLGTLEWPRSARAALVRPAEPERYMVGFPGGGLKLHPRDGTLIYSYRDLTLRSFVIDLQPPGGGEPADLAGGPGCSYPPDPVANDPVLSTPGCDDEGGVGTDFWLRADDGRLFYRCLRGPHVYRSVGADPIDAQAWPGKALSFGHQGTALVEDGIHQLAVVEIGSGEVHPTHVVLGEPRPRGGPVRAVTDGYWVALFDGRSDRISTLGHVGFDGVLRHVATYPPPPAGAHLVSGSWEGGRLDGDGDLWVVSRNPDGGQVLELVRDGIARVVYDERTFPEPLVRPGGPLITGP